MANQNLQRIPLTYASRTAFESATSGVTQPIMAHITGESAPCYGIKISGTYHYHVDKSAAVSALQASISALQNSDANLQAQISNISGLGVLPNGVLVPPEPLHYIANYDMAPKPLMAVKCVPHVNASPSSCSYVHINTSYARGEQCEWYLLPEDYGILRVYENVMDAEYNSDHVAEGYVDTDTPGFYKLESVSPSNEIWGWVEVTYPFNWEGFSAMPTLSQDNSFKFRKAMARIGDRYVFSALLDINTTGWDGGNIHLCPFITKSNGSKIQLVDDTQDGFPISRENMERGGSNAYIGLLNVSVVAEIRNLTATKIEWTLFLDMPGFCGWNTRNVFYANINLADLDTTAYFGMDAITEPGEGGQLLKFDLISSRVTHHPASAS